MASLPDNPNTPAGQGTPAGDPAQDAASPATLAKVARRAAARLALASGIFISPRFIPVHTPQPAEQQGVPNV